MNIWITLSLSLFVVLHKGEAKTLCTSDVDVVFIVDSSRSISLTNFKKEKDFVKSAAAEFDLAPDKSRAAVILFSAKATVMVDFGEEPTLKGFREAVDGIKHQEGGKTFIDKALRLATNVFSKARLDVKKVALLLTDGHQSDIANTDVEAAAKILRNKARVVAVGIGNHVLESELELITASKEDVILAKDYTDLQDKLLTIISTACPEGNCACTDGSSYITVEKYEEKKNREQDDIHFEFKTSQPSGTLMFIQGNVRDHIYVAYEHGREMIFRVDLGKGEGKLVAKDVKLDDNKWHKVKLLRVSRSYSITIDNHPKAVGEIPGDYNRLDIEKAKAYFLGAPKSRNLLPNFNGCIREFKVDGEAIIAHALGGDQDYSISNKDNLKACSEV